jgi:hypothetical protein
MQQRTGLGTTNPVSSDVFLPFYRVERSPARDSTSLLFPFGPTFTNDREKGYRELGTPWPFIVFASGPGKTAHRIWPLFGEAWNSAQEADFFLWPIFRHNRLQASPLERERYRILFFLYSHVTERNAETSQTMRRSDFWPLFTARTDTQGNRRLQILALAEPLVPGNRSIERNWSPLWSLWRAEHNATTETASRSLLWNLWRHERTPRASEWSLLFGLLQHRQENGRAQWGFCRAPRGRPQTTIPDGQAPH